MALFRRLGSSLVLRNQCLRLLSVMTSLQLFMLLLVLLPIYGPSQERRFGTSTQVLLSNVASRRLAEGSVI